MWLTEYKASKGNWTDEHKSKLSFRSIDKAHRQQINYLGLLEQGNARRDARMMLGASAFTQVPRERLDVFKPREWYKVLVGDIDEVLEKIKHGICQRLSLKRLLIASNSGRNYLRLRLSGAMIMKMIVLA